MRNKQKTTITRSILTVWLLAVSSIGMAQHATEVQQRTHHLDDVIRLESTLVIVPVIVSDRSGRYISGLKRDHFLLSEDGIEQSIAHFSNEEEPVTAAILIDTSSSASERPYEPKRAAISFVEQLRAQDRAMVVSFNDRVYIDREFTADHDALAEAIQTVQTGDRTQLYEAIYLTATQRLASVKGRKAIVLFSDGVDTSSGARRDQVLHYIEESGIFLYAIHLPPRSPYRSVYYCSNNFWNIFGPKTEKFPNEDYTEPVVPPKRGEEFLQQIVRVTGGRFYRSKQIDSEEQSDSVMAQIADELRHQYLLGYYATKGRPDGTFRRIRVRVRNRSDLAVRARSGYRAPLQGEAAQNGGPK